MIGSFEPYMKRLLDIVRRKVSNMAVDPTLGFALSTLWNLSGLIDINILDRVATKLYPP